MAAGREGRRRGPGAGARGGPARRPVTACSRRPLGRAGTARRDARASVSPPSSTTCSGPAPSRSWRSTATVRRSPPGTCGSRSSGSRRAGSCSVPAADGGYYAVGDRPPDLGVAPGRSCDGCSKPRRWARRRCSPGRWPRPPGRPRGGPAAALARRRRGRRPARPRSVSLQRGDLRGEASVALGLREVYLHLTNRCGSACRHCYNRANPWEPGELSTAEWRRAIDDCVALGASSFVFLGGDPLLRDDLCELLEHVTGRHGLKARLFFNSPITPGWPPSWRPRAMAVCGRW